MYKNTNIRDYFKPFTQPSRLNKRLLSEDRLEGPPAFRRSHSTTPKGSHSAERHGREAEHLEGGLHRTSSRGTLRSSSRESPGPWDEGPMESAEPAQVFGDDTSHIPLAPIPNGPVSRNPDILGLQPTSFMNSQRVVKNGEVVIRNSEDESESDSSLEDLNDLLLLEGRRAPGEPLCPEPQSRSSPLNRKAEDGRRMSRRHRTKTETVTAPLDSARPVQAKRYKFDLESLARHRKQEEASTENFARASTMLRSLEQQKVPVVGTAKAATATGPFDATFIDVVLKEHRDDDEISRLKAAIQRTEALSHGVLWSFFDEQAREPLFEQSKFPISEDKRLERVLGKTSARHQAFLSGYVSELAMKELLPKEILLWIMDGVCLESRDDLRYSYTATLTDASKGLASVLSPERIDMLFRKIGATAGALDIEGPVDPHPALSPSMEAVSRPNLLSILDLLRSLASNLSAKTTVHVICTLCRLVLDHSVANSCHVMSAIENALASLIGSISPQDLEQALQMVTTTAFKSITDATLRLRLLQSIPASSQRLILLRRRLALACFFEDTGSIRQHAGDTIDLPTVARHLEGPRFIISNATNYSELAAAIGILGIAIDCGGPPPSPCTTGEEKAFNRDIDVLSLKINSMFADIVDTGASHMGKTEAKEVLEAFQYWLSYGVRTKPPPKKSLFGDSTLQGIANRHVMESFIEKGKQNTSLVLPDSV